MTQRPIGDHSRSRHENPSNVRNCRERSESHCVHSFCSADQATTSQTTRTGPGVASREIESQFDQFPDARVRLEPGIVTALFAAEPLPYADGIEHTPDHTRQSSRRLRPLPQEQAARPDRQLRDRDRLQHRLEGRELDGHPEGPGDGNIAPVFGPATRSSIGSRGRLEDRSSASFCHAGNDDCRSDAMSAFPDTPACGPALERGAGSRRACRTTVRCQFGLPRLQPCTRLTRTSTPQPDRRAVPGGSVAVRWVFRDR